MKIIASHTNPEDNSLVVLTDESRHRITVPDGIVNYYSDRHNSNLAVRGFCLLELDRRRAARLFRDRRHDHFKGFRA